MNEDCLEPHKKDFLTECQQIEFWTKCFQQIYSQIYTLDQISNIEEQACNSKANHLTQLSNDYYVNCQKVSGEPSNIFYLTQIILDMYLKNITISRSQIARLNSDLSNSIKDILNGISFVKEKILQVSQKTMREVTELRHNSALTQAKYAKLKLNLNEAQMNKKRLESNPKYAYNITMKTQAEQRVLEKVQQMEKILPSMDLLAKSLTAKKEEFNLIMKDNFEIVILNTFKHLAHLHQCFFLMAKIRLDISSELKTVIHDSFTLLTKFSVNINDFTEKKFAALQGIKFDSIEMLNINEEFTKSNVGQLINASNSVINYVSTFYSCLKMRKTLMKRSLKYFTQYKTYERESKESFNRKEKKFSEILQTMTSLGNGTSTSWKILFNSFHINDTAKEKTIIINEIVEYITQSKCDYTALKQKWSKIEEKIIEKRNEIEAIDVSIRKKLQDNFSTASPTSNNKKIIEEQINKKIMQKSPQLITILNQAHDFIKITLSSIREKDIKRCNKMIETFSSTVKNLEESVDKSIELFQNELEISAKVDLFEEIECIFTQYFNKFNITNYESFMEKIKMKILLKSNFHKEKLGMNTINKMNEMNISSLNNNNNNTIAQLKSMIKVKKSDDDNNILNLSDQMHAFERNDEEEFEFNQEKSISSIDDNNDDGIRLNFIKKTYKNDKGNNDGKESHSLISIIEKNDKKQNDQAIDNLKDKVKSNNVSPIRNQQLQSVKAIKNLSRSGSSGPSMSQSNQPSNLIISLDEEKMDFINKKNFDIIDQQCPYQNFKAPEIAEYKNKLEDEIPTTPKTLFPLEEGEHIQNDFRCAYASGILLQGRMYVTNKKIVFDSLFNSNTIIGKGGTRLCIPLKDITKVINKSHLYFFNNSIEIHTSKTELFFTSFIYRDQCADLISKSINNLGPIEDRKENILVNEDNEPNANNLAENPNPNIKMTKYPKLKMKRIKTIATMLKDMDFFNRLEQIHQKRLEEFNSFTKDEFYLPHSQFKETYIDEVISTAPPVVIFNFIFNPYTSVDEFNHNKCFFESIYIDRKDTDIELNIAKDNKEIPAFFTDLDFNMSLFGNFNQNELENFLNDIPNWSKIFKYEIKVFHPIKKYFIGPEKIHLENHVYIYFVSPKCLVVDDCSYGIGFVFSDTFVSITQYRFDIDYSFNEKKGKFQFEVKCTISFLVKFVKSCLLAGKIGGSGYETAAEGIRYYLYDKLKIVIDNQSGLFSEMLNKLTDDTIQRKVLCEKCEDDDDGEMDEICEEDKGRNEEMKGVQIQSQVFKYEYDAKNDNMTNASGAGKKSRMGLSKKVTSCIIAFCGIIILLCMKYYLSNDPDKNSIIPFDKIIKMMSVIMKKIVSFFSLDNVINIGILLIAIWLINNIK